MNNTAHFSQTLDHDWARRTIRRRDTARVRSWASFVPDHLADHFETVLDLDELVAATQGEVGTRANEVLLTLVQIAQADGADGELAGRIVVQRLLPGLISGASRYRHLGDRVDPVAEAVGALWMCITKYDTAERRNHVAASLLSDTLYEAFRRRPQKMAAQEKPAAPLAFDRLRADNDRGATERIAEVIAAARCAGVPTYDLDLLRLLVRSDSAKHAAAQRGITTRTLRTHRDKAVDRVRRAVVCDPVAA